MRILGGIVILITSIVSSYLYEKNITSKIKNLNDTINFLSYVRGQIEYFSHPLNRIYDNYESKTEFIVNLIENKAVIGLDEDISSKINTCLVSLGGGYKKEQLSIIDYTLSESKEKLKAMENNKPNKIKVFRAISLFTGICIIILLV